MLPQQAHQIMLTTERLKLRGWDIRDYPVHHAREPHVEWCTHIWHAEHCRTVTYFYRPLRHDCIAQALQTAIMLEVEPERRDTVPAPAMGDDHAAQ